MNNKPATFAGLDLSRPRIMGILNLTPDSFSDGGKWLEPAAGLAQAVEMINQGADIIDIGGESTRPGSSPVSVEEQLARTVDVIRALKNWLDKNPTIPNHDPSLSPLARQVVKISIDTGRPEVARGCIAAGADIINDVYGGREVDGDGRTTIDVAAETGCSIILMHMQGTPASMQQNPTYGNVVDEVMHDLYKRVEKAVSSGVNLEKIAIDPGIGFGKTKEHNMQLMAHLERFVKTGVPVLLGTSRKRFMGAICASPDGKPAAAYELIGATCATTSLGVYAGVQMFRVHDVKENRQSADVTAAILALHRHTHF